MPAARIFPDVLFSRFPYFLHTLNVGAVGTDFRAECSSLHNFFLIQLLPLHNVGRKFYDHWTLHEVCEGLHIFGEEMHQAWSQRYIKRMHSFVNAPPLVLHEYSCRFYIDLNWLFCFVYFKQNSLKLLVPLVWAFWWWDSLDFSLNWFTFPSII